MEIEQGAKRLVPEERQSLDSPGNVVDGAVGGEDGGFSGGEGESDQALAGDFEIGFAVGSDLHDAAFSSKGSGYVGIAFDVEGEALRAAETTI